MEPPATSGEPTVLGMAGDDVLAALATVVRRPRKRRPTAVATQQQTANATSPGPCTTSSRQPLSAAAQLLNTSARAAPEPSRATTQVHLPLSMVTTPVTMARVCPQPSTISPMQLASTTRPPMTTTRATSPEPSSASPVQLSSAMTTDQAIIITTESPKTSSPAQQASSPRGEAIQVGNDPALASDAPVAGRSTAISIPMDKRKKMIEFWRENNGCTLADVARVGQCSVSQAAEWVAREKRGEGLMDKPKGRKPKWPVPKAVMEIAKLLPEIHFTDDEVNLAADAAGIPRDNFKRIRSDVKSRLQTAVVDHWFGGDLRGEREVLRYIKEAVKSIKIGVEWLSNKEVIGELTAAVGRRVDVMLVISLKRSYDAGLEGVKALLEAGVQACHCTVDLHWNAAIFDGQILVQGSQSWTDNNEEDSNMACTMVHIGPIVSAFECQFDTMWNKAIKTVNKGGKKARDAIVADLNGEVQSSAGSDSDEGPSKRRKMAMSDQGKRVFFPTTFELLGLLGA